MPLNPEAIIVPAPSEIRLNIESADPAALIRCDRSPKHSTYFSRDGKRRVLDRQNNMHNVRRIAIEVSPDGATHWMRVIEVYEHGLSTHWIHQTQYLTLGYIDHDGYVYAMEVGSDNEERITGSSYSFTECNVKAYWELGAFRGREQYRRTDRTRMIRALYNYLEHGFARVPTRIALPSQL